MKRAQAEVAGAAPFQLYKTTNHIQYINAVKNLLYGGLGDHTEANISMPLQPEITLFCRN